MDEGVVAGHLSLGPLHRDGHRLFGIGKKSLVEQMQRDEFRIKLRGIFDVDLNAEKFHSGCTSFVKIWML